MKVIDVDDVGDDARDVVGAARFEGEFDEVLGAFIGVVDAREDVADGFERDEPREAIGAQHPAVAWDGWFEAQVEFGIGVDITEDAHDHRALRVAFSFFRGEAPFVDEALHERVVFCDLGARAFAHKVGAGVTDVDERELVARAQERGDGRAEAREKGFFASAPQDGIVCVKDGALECGDDVGSRCVGFEFRKRAHGD